MCVGIAALCTLAVQANVRNAMKSFCALVAMILSSALGVATAVSAASPSWANVLPIIESVATGESELPDVRKAQAMEVRELLEPRVLILIRGGEKAEASNFTICSADIRARAGTHQTAGNTGLAFTQWPIDAYTVWVVPKPPSDPSLPPSQGTIVGTGVISTLNGQTRNLLYTPEDALRQVKRNPLMTPDDHPKVQLVKLQSVKHIHAAKVIPKASKPMLHPSR